MFTFTLALTTCPDEEPDNAAGQRVTRKRALQRSIMMKGARRARTGRPLRQNRTHPNTRPASERPVSLARGFFIILLTPRPKLRRANAGALCRRERAVSRQLKRLLACLAKFCDASLWSSAGKGHGSPGD